MAFLCPIVLISPACKGIPSFAHVWNNDMREKTQGVNKSEYTLNYVTLISSMTKHPQDPSQPCQT